MDNENTMNEILETVRFLKDNGVTKTELVEIKSDIVEIKSDIVEINSDIADLKSDVHELNTTMVTKDYLDRKVQEFKDESTIKLRKENEKVATVVRALRDKTLFSDTEAQGILVMEPFPLPK